MAILLRLGRILGILLITVFATGYTTEPEPDPVNKSFVSVFDSKRTRADRYFNNFEYKSAIKLYNKIIKKGKQDDDVILRLAQSYLKINDPVNAEKWFEKVIHSDRITPQHQIEYAHTLMSNGKYQKAREVINSYEFAQSDYRSKAIINTLEKLEVFYADSVYYQLETIQDNKPHYSDFSPTVYKDGIVFVSSRHDKGPKFKWDETPFLDLYYTESDVASAKPFSKNLNSKYHEGPIAFYDNFSKAVFTRSNYLDKELGMTDEGINNLQLYTASWNESLNDWDNISPIEFSINNYSYGHPTISTDGSKLYFVSDMPGGFGGTDLYVSERTETGWGDPVNMGEVINTSGNEMYPFIDDQDNLYFASNGHGGLGGLDVFQVKLTESLDIKNMGYPLNTTADDFGFSLTPDGEIAYISSNREGADNIFQIDIKAPDLDVILADNSVNSEVPVLDESLELLATNELSTPENEEFDASELSTINAAVIDENSEVLNNAKLELLIDGEKSQTIMSDENGLISLQVPADKQYTLIASKEGFEDREINIPAQTLGLEEDLLIVMNSTLVDSDINNEVPTAELDPLAVTDDPWNESAIEDSDRPAINGVALTEMPNQADENNNVDNTTELDPLAVTDDPWNETAIEQSDRPAINGVALTEMPNQTDGSTDVDNTTELDPLAVTDDPWDESAIEESDRPAINGVALTEMPNQAGKNSNVDNTTELDPLAVTDDPWNESAINEGDRPAINGVALTEMPNQTDENSNVDNTTELDPLAVTDDPWNESAINEGDRPAINGVALTEIPNQTDENSNVDNTTELDPLAVNDDPWNESAINGGDRPAINGVALTDVPNQADENSNVDNTTELDPLAVNNDPWNESAINEGDRPAISGVALTEMPNQAEENSNVDNATELDPLAVNDNPWNESAIESDNPSSINGLALTEIADKENGSDPQAENLSTDTNKEQPFDETEFEELAIEDNTLNNSQLEEGIDSEEESLALNEASSELNSDYPNDAETNDFDPLATADAILDQEQVLAENALAANKEQSAIEEGSSSSNSEQLVKFDQYDNNGSNPINDQLLANNDQEFNNQDQISDASLSNTEAAVNRNDTQFDQVNQTQNKIEGLATTESDLNSSESPVNTTGGMLVDAVALDTKSRLPIAAADIKLFIDSPNEPLDYELKDGVLTFDARPDEDYIIVASHDDYQDQFINISGDDLLAGETSELNLALTKTDELPTVDKSKNGSSTKFKAVVRDDESNELLDDAEVKFFVDGKAVESEFSKDNGKTVFKSPDGNDYMMLVSREGYQDLIYHMPGIPEDNMDVDLSMLKATDYVQPEYQLLAVKDRVLDRESGDELNDITFKVFEDGDLIETTNDLLSLEVNPEKEYRILASKQGYQESIMNLGPDQLSEKGIVELEFELEEQQISEATGYLANEVVDDQALPIVARVFDITDDQPLSETLVIVFADNEIQDQLTSWNTGSITINAIPGKDYQLLVQRDGYSDRIIALGVVNESASDNLSIALVPEDIKKIRQADIDLTEASMLVMEGPTGEDQLYLSTNDELYQYSIENDNHYLIKDGEKIMLKERKRSLKGKVTSKQDSDQFTLRSEDQFLYDQLTGDEKAMVDKVVNEMVTESDLTNNPELAIYYNNLPPEFRSLVDRMVENSEQLDQASFEMQASSAERLKQALAENSISVSTILNVNNIYYDFDKSSIRADAAVELDKLLAIMQNNKNIRVVMFSHTDSRGSNSYNDVLSKKRGSSAVNYLVERGISIDRFTTQAKGETQLVNSCGDQIKCNEADHQLNRRTEFLLTA